MSYSNSDSTLTVTKDPQRSPVRILIVDNQSLSSELLRSQLKPEPLLTVIGAVHTEVATMEVVKNFHPDLVVIDFEAPEIDGFDLVSKLRYNFPQVKTLVFTSQNQLARVNQAIALGAKGFLIKNSSTEEVKEVLATVIRDRSMNTKLQLSPGEADLAQYEDSKAETSSAIVPASSEALPAIITEREDWSAATKDLMDSLPRVWTRGLLYFLVIGTAILIPWSVLTKVDQTGTARGKLEPKDRVIELDAPVGAKIKAINVKEGQEVKKGAILAELESEIVNSELKQLQDQKAGLQERLNQLELMRNQAKTSLITKDEQTRSRSLEKDSQIAQAEQNFNTLKAVYESQKGEKLAQIEQAKQEINSSIAVRKEAEVALKGAQEKAKRYKQAYEEGVISQDRYLDIQQQAAENQERLSQAKSALEQARSRLKEQENSYQNLIKNSTAEIKQAELRLQEQRSGSQTITSSGKLEQIQIEEQIQDLTSQISNTQTELAQTKKQIEASQFQLKQRQLLAPADGTVFQIAARGEGSVVQPGESIIEIAPQNSNLILKANIPPTDSGFLKPDMPVKIKFDAYPFQDYGVSEGKLISISPDSKTIETPQGAQEVYELKIELDKSYILDGNKQVELTPGQTATAEIIIRQRRVIDFFLDPFKKLQEDGVKL